MKIITKLDQIPVCTEPITLTLGSFDGMHLGHQHLFRTLKKLAGKKGTSVVFTFKNHPYSYFHPEKKLFPLCTLEQRLHLFEQYNIDLVLLVGFNKHFAEQPFHLFLQHLHKRLPFSHLVLGKGAVFGKKRQGNEMNIKKIAKELDFTAHYLPKKERRGITISSTHIRSAIQQGKFHEAKSLLGRPFSLEFHGENLQKIPPLGSFQLSGLPLQGWYQVQLIQAEKRHQAILYSDGEKAQVIFPLKDKLQKKVSFECIFEKALS